MVAGTGFPARLAAGALLAAAVAGCASLPSHEGRIATEALPPSAATRLGTALGPMVSAHPGLTGIHALPVASDAFAARMVLATAAERSLDIQ